MKQNEKLWNPSYNAVDYGTERLSKTSTIAVNPDINDRYEESTTDDITKVILTKEMDAIMYEEYMSSKWHDKYGNDIKKVDRGDMVDLYYYFKSALMKRITCNCVEAFCCIAEFFDMNYKTLYNEVISIKDKSEILDYLRENYNIGDEFSKMERLF